MQLARFGSDRTEKKLGDCAQRVYQGPNTELAVPGAVQEHYHRIGPNAQCMKFPMLKLRFNCLQLWGLVVSIYRQHFLGNGITLQLMCKATLCSLMSGPLRFAGLFGFVVKLLGEGRMLGQSLSEVTSYPKRYSKLTGAW